MFSMSRGATARGGRVQAARSCKFAMTPSSNGGSIPVRIWVFAYYYSGTAPHGPPFPSWANQPARARNSFQMAGTLVHRAVDPSGLAALRRAEGRRDYQPRLARV